MYIKQSDVKSIFDTYNSSIYVGRIRLTLTCSNAYGSSGSALTDSDVFWWYTPEKPTDPVYSVGSYYILPDSTDPVFLINRRANYLDLGGGERSPRRRGYLSGIHKE